MRGTTNATTKPRHVWMLDLPANRRHAALRPRRCAKCGAPVLLATDGTMLDDDATTRHRHQP